MVLAERVARVSVAGRWWLLAVVGLITLLAASVTGRLELNDRFEIWFVEGDPDLLRYEQFLSHFGSDEFLVLGLEFDGLFTPDGLARVRRIANAVSEVDHVRDVVSLTNVIFVHSRERAFRVAPLVGAEELDREVARYARRMALESPVLRGRLVSRDGKATGILVEIEKLPERTEYKPALVAEVRGIAEHELAGTDAEVHIAGGPALDVALFERTREDLRRLLPIAVIVILAVIWFVFWRPAALLLPTVVVAVTLIWIFGFMGLAGIELNFVSVILAPLSVALGVVTASHLWSQYEEECVRGYRGLVAVRRALARVFEACAFSSATTAGALFALATSHLQPVRTFGLLAGAASLVSLLVAFALAPVLLARVRPPRFEERARGVGGALERLGSPSRRRAGLTALLGALFVAASFPGIEQLEMGTNPIEFFRKGDPIRRDTMWTDRNLAGSVPGEFSLRGPPHAFEKPRNLERLAAFESDLEALPEVTSALSIIDYLEQMTRALGGGQEGDRRVPGSRGRVAQALLLIEGSPFLQQRLQADRSRTRVTAYVRYSRAQELSQSLGKVEGLIDRHFEDTSIAGELTGYLKLMANMESYLLQTQIRSFATAFAIVSIAMFVVLRSVRLGLVALIPNLPPLVVVLGVMGYSGIPVNITTAMVVPIALGFVVDDTVHMLTRYRTLDAASAAVSLGAVATAVREAGRPILASSAALAAGFWILLFASFQPAAHFGLLSGVVVLLALAFDVLVLPAVLRVWRG